MSGMGLVGELALTDKALPLSTRALKERQTSKRVFHVFFFITICQQTQGIAGNPKLFLVLFLLLSGKLRIFAASTGEESEK